MRIISGLLSVLFFLSFNLNIFAGTSNRENLLENDFVKLKILSSERLRVSKVSVQQYNDILEISGEVRRRNIGASTRGHIDIAILDSKENLIKELSTVLVPETIPPRRFHSRRARFDVRIPLIVLKGSKVVLAYHKKQTEHSNTFKCHDNAALKKE